MEALILVDLQHDFMPGGALGVPGGDEVLDVALEMSRRLQWVFATQDWHPAGHKSFASSHPGKQVGDSIKLNGLDQNLWPDHCVQGTRGAELVEPIAALPLAGIVRKGQDPEVDSYSGFFDNGRRHETELRAVLEERRLRKVIVMGLATDFCVKATALDAIACGFEVSLLVPGCRAVNLRPDDGAQAIQQMEAAGITLLHELPN
ncbi:MAG: bifunctional nicotinamidase/pyrazinamidase [Planctomycetales bacterium]|nr:bifunctional nicotinamidase/pyrazinamidase [Planctomycetales bacterium]